MKRRAMDYTMILLSVVFAYCYCALDLSDTYAYYNPYSTPALSAAYGRQGTTYPTILQTGFSSLGQPIGLGVSSLGLPVAPNIGDLFLATSFGTGIYGIYGPGAVSPSLLGFNRFAAGSEDALVRSAQPTDFFQGMNQNPFPYSIFETPEMNYYNLLGIQSMLANPFEYARAMYFNPLYQNPYLGLSAYQAPYQTLLSNSIYSPYQNTLSTPWGGSWSYLDPIAQLLGLNHNPFAPVNYPVISPDYSTKMYVLGEGKVNGDITVYLIIKDDGEGMPEDPEELKKRTGEFVKLEEYNSTFSLNLHGKTCDICLYQEYPRPDLYQEYRILDRVWAWAEKWWPLENK